MGAVNSSNTSNFSSKLDVELYEAVERRSVREVKQLLDKGAQYNITTLDEKTALSVAIENGSVRVVDAFTNYRKFTSIQPETMIYYYVINNSWRIASYLEEYYYIRDLQCKIDKQQAKKIINVNLTQSNFKITCLHISVIKKDIKACKLLIKYGAKIDILDINDDTPLMYAASIQSEQMMRFLLSHGANPRLKNKFGKKAQHFLLPGKTGLADILKTAESIPLLILAHKNDPNSSLYKDNLAPDVFKQIIRLLL